MEENLSVPDALGRLAGFEKAKFDETVELSFFLGVDPKQSAQAVRGTVNLPHGSGKEITVLVFTEKTEEALSAGADIAGLDDLIAKIKDGWMEFDVALSTTEAMKSVRSVARVVGPRGLMPTPKAGRVEFKMDKTGVLAVVIGKRSFSQDQLQENAQTALEAVAASRPQGYKGKFIKTVHLSSTMSPAVRINATSVNQ
jgi:large subunit ribosomal protein L1